MNKIALTVRTAIERALARFQLPDSEAAVRLLLMIAAHESDGFLFCRQKGGPALGLFQMEQATYKAVLDYLQRSGKFPAISRSLPAERMLIDAEFAAAIARVYLYSFPEPLPDADDFAALASYAKKYWNTDAGKASAEKYLADFMQHVWGEKHA